MSSITLSTYVTIIDTACAVFLVRLYAIPAKNITLLKFSGSIFLSPYIKGWLYFSIALLNPLNTAENSAYEKILCGGSFGSSDGVANK